MSLPTLQIPMTELQTLASLDFHIIRGMIADGASPAFWTASIQALKASRWHKHGAYTVLTEDGYRPGAYVGQLYAEAAAKPVVKELMRNSRLINGPKTLISFSHLTQDPWLALFMFSIAHGYSSILGPDGTGKLTIDASGWPRPRRMRKRGGR